MCCRCLLRVVVFVVVSVVLCLWLFALCLSCCWVLVVMCVADSDVVFVVQFISECDGVFSC